MAHASCTEMKPENSNKYSLWATKQFPLGYKTINGSVH